MVLRSEAQRSAVPSWRSVVLRVVQVEDMSRILIEHGFSYSGKDMLTSGITGEPCEAFVFFGPIYYQACFPLHFFSLSDQLSET